MIVSKRKRLLRTQRFDSSDDRVFDVAAQAGEWVVSGAFEFSNAQPDDLTGKVRQAFANGFLGVQSFGRSTFAAVSEASEEDYQAITHALADHFVKKFGAPTIDAAMPEALSELAFIEDLVKDAPLNTVFTVRRTFVDTSTPGQPELREQFRTIKPPTDEPRHARIWTIDQNETEG